MPLFERISLLRQYLKKQLWAYHSSRRYSARQAAFQDSRSYWEERYKEGRTSGSGSYGKLKAFKAAVLNEFVQEHHVRSVIEFGCGDGNQLIGLSYPAYLGLDVSQTAVGKCQELFKDDETKKFKTVEEYNDEIAELSLSLDVIYHLVEDDVFENYMRALFMSSRRYVVIYSSNENIVRKNQGRHVRHRKFTDWIGSNIEEWRVLRKIENDFPYSGVAGEGSHADFYIYEKVNRRDSS
jgi:SAM-dependent methyltransferase